MFDFNRDVIEPKAKFHVFIGNTKHASTKEAFEVCKYSILSQASEDVSIISVDPITKFSVPLKAKELGLSGRALYIDACFLFKGDIIELFKETEDSEKLLWVVKFKDKIMWSSLMIFNLDNLTIYDKVPYPDRSYSQSYLYKFYWINRKESLGELEIGELPKEWNFIPEQSEKFISYENIKAINYLDVRRQPWFTPSCKYSCEWYREYMLYFQNVVYINVKKHL